MILIFVDEYLYVCLYIGCAHLSCAVVGRVCALCILYLLMFHYESIKKYYSIKTNTVVQVEKARVTTELARSEGKKTDFAMPYCIRAARRPARFLRPQQGMKPHGRAIIAARQCNPT